MAETIRIGICGPYVGGSSAMGISMRDGVLLAVEDLNRGGGVLGRKIEPLVRDDQASVEVADRLARSSLLRASQRRSDSSIPIPRSAPLATISRPGGRSS
jgi:ABC-type branched-subunit amino acid transport system substrate-binding protein